MVNRMKDFYEQLGLNYGEVIGRLGSDGIIRKFVIKFLSDKSYQNLKEGLEEKDVEKAFRAAHTLKGICLNLGFSNLYTPSSAITEKLRGGEMEGCEELFAQVQAEYEKLETAIQKIAAEE